MIARPGSLKSEQGEVRQWKVSNMLPVLEALDDNVDSDTLRIASKFLKNDRLFTKQKLEPKSIIVRLWDAIVHSIYFDKTLLSLLVFP